MKLQKISSQLLKYMVDRFHEDGKECFNYVEFKNTFPNVKEHELKTALYNLQSDHLVSISSYDNEPSITILDVKAILKIDEDTLIRKGYEFVKEIISILG